MHKLIPTFILLIFSTLLIAQETTTVRGFVVSKSSGEPAPYVHIQIVELETGAMTDMDGFFSIPKVKQGTYTIKVEAVQFVTITETITTGHNEFLNLKFEMETTKMLKSVEVSAKEKERQTNVETSVIKMTQKEIERIPSMGGESDVLTAFSVVPGVVTSGDQGGQMYVRGGTPIQNKVLLDGMTIYNPFHSIGFFSVFETELVKSMDVYTGGFSAKYGGRISSIMDITYRDGNKKHFSGKISGSPFMGRFVLEGPMYRDKDSSGKSGTFMFSAKRSLIDLSSRTLYPYANNGGGLPFTFTDIYGKMTFNAGNSAKVSLFGFGFNDRVKYTNLANIGWKSYGGGLNFSLVPGSSPVFVRGHLNASSYKIDMAENFMQPRYSGIFGFDLGFDFSYYLKHSSQLDYGVNVNGFNTNYTTYNEMQQKIADSNFTAQIAIYVDYKLVVGRLVINPSFRGQYYATLSTFSPEPRLGLKYNITEKFRLKASGGRYSQNFTSTTSDKNVVNLFNGFLSAPTDVQDNFVKQNGKVKSNIKNGLQYAWHAVFGMEYDFAKHWTLNIEGYYKKFTQLSNINLNKIYPDISEFSKIDDVYKKDYIIEQGQAYGGDLLVKYSGKRLYVYAGYSIMKVTRWDGFKQYSPLYDRRHNANLIVTYQFLKKKDLEVSVRWNYGSGLLFTPTVGYYQNELFSGGLTTDIMTSNASLPQTILGDLNSKRLPAYHRLDITVKKKFEFKNKTYLDLILSVTNVYNRKNIFYVNRVTNEKIYQLPVLPSIGLSYNF
jgi:hypothetical protein